MTIKDRQEYCITWKYINMCSYDENTYTQQECTYTLLPIVTGMQGSFAHINFLLLITFPTILVPAARVYIRVSVYIAVFFVEGSAGDGPVLPRSPMVRIYDSHS